MQMFCHENVLNEICQRIFLLQQRRKRLALSAGVEDGAELAEGEAAVPEGEVIDVGLHVVTVVRGAVLAKIPVHAAVDDGVFHVFDNPIECAVGLALAEADDAFGRDGDGVEGPLVRVSVIYAHIRAFRVRLAAEIEFDG